MRYVSAVKQHKTVLDYFNPNISDGKQIQGCCLGMDTHADTLCVNKYAYIEHVVGEMTVDAIPFNNSIGKTEGLLIVHAIYAMDDTVSFITYLIPICNAIYIPHMKQGLLCPNQACKYGTIIDNVTPKLHHSGLSTFSVNVPNCDETQFPPQHFGSTANLQA